MHMCVCVPADLLWSTIMVCTVCGMKYVKIPKVKEWYDTLLVQDTVWWLCLLNTIRKLLGKMQPLILFKLIFVDYMAIDIVMDCNGVIYVHA